MTLEKLGSLDILVNNAGILEMGSIENTSLDQYDKVMNTNVRAIYQLTMLAVPHLIKTQGRNSEGNSRNEDVYCEIISGIDVRLQILYFPCTQFSVCLRNVENHHLN